MQLLQCLFVTWRRQVILEVGHTNRADYESKVQLEVEKIQLAKLRSEAKTTDA